METNNKKGKIKTALAGAMVLTMAIVFSAFRSNGETVARVNVDESVFEFTMELADFMTQEVLEIEEQVFKTAKVFNSSNELVEMVVMLEHESIEDIYTGAVFNQAEFLTSYGDVSIYRIAD